MEETITVEDLIDTVNKMVDVVLCSDSDEQTANILGDFVQYWRYQVHQFEKQKRGSNMSTSALIRELVQDNTDAFKDAVEEQLRTTVQDYIDEHIEDFAKDKAMELAESIGDECLNKLTEEYRD